MSCLFCTFSASRRHELDSVLGICKMKHSDLGVDKSLVRTPSPWSLPWTHPSFLADVEAMLQHVM